MSLLDASLFGAASVAVSAASLVATGVFHPRVMLFGPGIWRGPSRQNAVALTFDDGPHPHYTARIAEVLARHGARATFFCIGRELERYASLARELLDAGHQLENHTYRHDTGRDLFSASRLEGDLERCQQVLVQVTGARARYYRPAVGIRNPAVHEAARRVGMTVVTWTLAARDGARRLTPKRALALAERARPGSILALHDGSPRERSPLREHTLQQLPLLLSRLRERGFSFVTLSELLSA
ncbi:polysaccharide deacetylase family protein [Vitiosangium sp. GDMCC 1.1324]|uniref:polysaccharide deacetylase family protein n=1 Tax=Vitiosangium sp. (strain GDMCC 1.1324) TaxID=2138576 RepID=UPI00130DAC8D|nr:polysaccharide deacetylase family protein [Vitiosangium sp. GDMCC 1.1324]